ncbi:MAG: TetR/AcrR family transcriptional regulator [Sphaerochaetaceae bacterium]|nr:TetR/AcrR family transcriptional regulator [Sphaerochaetaceae bacterium]
MPKIIPDARKIILSKTEELMKVITFSDLTMRDVAKEVKMALGTLYNYYPSKEAIVSHVIASNWVEILENMKKSCDNASSLEESLGIVFNSISAFSEKWENFWSTYVFSPKSSYNIRERREFFKNQILDFIRPVFEKNNVELEDDVYDFITESLISTASQKGCFNKFFHIISRLWETNSGKGV